MSPNFKIALTIISMALVAYAVMAYALIRLLPIAQS